MRIAASVGIAAAVALGATNAVGDEGCSLFQTAEIHLEFCDPNEKWSDWFESGELSPLTTTMAHGFSFVEKASGIVALVRPFTIANGQPTSADERSERLLIDLTMVGVALEYLLATPRTAPISRTESGWAVPADTVVFESVGAGSPTVFVTHAHQDDSSVYVYTIVPRVLRPEEIERHLAQDHADFLAAVQLHRLGGWSRLQ